MGKVDSKKETAQNEARFETILQAHGDAGVLFVQNLERILKSRNLSKHWLSGKLQKKDGYISALCRGHCTISTYIISEIATALHMEVEDFFRKPKADENPYVTEKLLPKIKYAEDTDIDRLCSYYDAITDIRKEERERHLRQASRRL